MDLSAIKNSVKAFEDAPEMGRYEPLPGNAFPSASLFAWIALAHASGVPCVPASLEATIPIEPLLHFDAPIEGTSQALSTLDRLNETVSDDLMLRWDCCAPWGVKSAMANGLKRPSRQEMELEAGDPRAFDLIYDFPAEDIGVFSRPWVPAMIFEDYPVEFRVFVDNAKVVGISNYYPQRKLPDHPKIRRMASEIAQQAQRMVEKAVERNMQPWMPRVDAARQPSFCSTLDFLVRSSGGIVFLEGGPGYGYGAHPCCFAKHLHGMTGANPVKGLCLEIGKPAIPLSDLA